MSFAENLQLRILQKLPARFYFNVTDETSFRDETNPFQFPRKASLMRGSIPPPNQFRLEPIQTQVQLYNTIGEVARNDMVFRTLPNVTAGWTLFPHTRLYGNYFMIRDALMHEMRLNTVIHSIGYGIQQDIPLRSNLNLQLDFQCRELFQLHQRPVFDFLPGGTLTYIRTPRTVFFANALIQLRGKDYFQSPNKEMDPFYTWGGLYQKNGWSFSASTTFVQNFRQPFTSQATIPVNNYSFISDYEIARRVLKQIPGLQAFARAEPIFNFHGKDKPGLSGMDFRIFCGLRLSMAKPALTSQLEQLKQQLEEQENEPPNGAPQPNTPSQSKPSAYVPPHELVASKPQPIHGFFDDAGKEGKSIAVADFADYQDDSAASSSASVQPSSGMSASQLDRALSTVPNDGGITQVKADPQIGLATESQQVSLH
jgi:hypothetical protein